MLATCHAYVRGPVCSSRIPTIRLFETQLAEVESPSRVHVVLLMFQNKSFQNFPEIV